MIPAAQPAGHYPHTNAVVHHLVDEWTHLVRVGAGVALPDANPHAQNGFRVVGDLGAAADGHPAQRVVALSVLDHHRDRGVAAQVYCLLRLGLGFEPDLAVDHRVPHCDQVRPAVGEHGGHCRGPAALNEVGDLVVGHDDL